MDPIIVGIIIAFIAPVGAYLVAARQLSGQIKNSDATELWVESRSIRDWATARVKELSDHVNELEKRLNDLEVKNSEMAEQNRQLTRANYDLKNLMIELETVNEALTVQLDEKQAEIDRLKLVVHGGGDRVDDPDPPNLEGGQ